MEAPKYKIRNVLDIARLPEEALPRFLKELPELIGMIREVDKFHKASVEGMDAEEAEKALAEVEDHLLENLEWVDDHRTDIEFKMTGKDEQGAEVLRMHASSKTRDFGAFEKGEDKTYDYLLIGRLNRSGMTLTPDDIEGMMPEGKLIIPASKLREIHDITPQSLNELCISANRILCISDPDEHTPLAWLEVAQKI